MLSILISTGFSLLIVLSPSTNEESNSKTHDSNTYYSNNKDSKIHNLKSKYDNMSTSEIDMTLKENDWYHDYGDCSRQYKIDKVIEKMSNRY